jgi:predicted ATPase
MAVPRLDRISVEGYLSIRSVDLRLRDLNLLIGANGSGKSNFISALELLGRIVDGDLGWYVVAKRGGATQLMHDWNTKSQLTLRVEGQPNGYEAVIEPAANDEMVFASERIWVHHEGYEEPYDVDLGRGHRETRLHDYIRTGPRAAIARHVRDLLQGCRVYHFHDTSRTAPVKQFGDAGNNLALSPDAGNLAAFLRRLRGAAPPSYRRIVSAVQQVAPFFRDFVLEEEADGRLRLRWRQYGNEGAILAGALSDGTLRFICLATLLLQPEPPPLVVLDEPELGLHPYSIVLLASMLEAASRRSQLVVATQSVTLTSQFGISDLVIVERSDNSSVFSRPDPERLSVWLEDYSLGELWEKNLLGGTPGRE